MPDADDFGENFYSYPNGERHLTGAIRTIRPLTGETSARFEERMDRFAQVLTLVEVAEGTGIKASEIEVRLIKRRGLIVECVMVYHHQPIPAPLGKPSQAAA